MIRHLIYIAYYLLHTSPAEISRLVRYVKKEKNVSAIFLLKDILFSSIKYKISFMDYFSFRLYNLDADGRNEYIGAGAMYEYQLKMNPKKYRTVLSDKIHF